MSVFSHSLINPKSSFPKQCKNNAESYCSSETVKTNNSELLSKHFNEGQEMITIKAQLFKCWEWLPASDLERTRRGFKLATYFTTLRELQAMVKTSRGFQMVFFRMQCKPFSYIFLLNMGEMQRLSVFLSASCPTMQYSK